MTSKNALYVHGFCRASYNSIMVEVRQNFTAEEIKASWVWDSGGGRKQYEFHGPNKEYIYGLTADCLWSAKAEAWSKMLEAKKEGRKVGL
jgi:hypothetical protein